MASVRKIIQSMLEFLKAPFLFLHLSYYYNLMTFLMMLNVILLSMMMILLPNISVIRLDLWQKLALTSALESDLRDTHTYQPPQKHHPSFSPSTPSHPPKFANCQIPFQATPLYILFFLCPPSPLKIGFYNELP